MGWDETEFHAELSWCPDCQSPTNDKYTHVRYCDMHMPTSSGALDRIVDDPTYITRGEAGGESNRAVCAFFHTIKEIN